jgi:hypothetical protein
MKRLAVLLTAICLVFAIAGNAAADFTFGANSSLALSIYDPTGDETGYDLGLIGAGLDLTATNQSLGSVTVTSGNYVALYSANSDYTSFYGLTDPGAPGINSSGIVSFQNNIRGIWNMAYENGASPVTIESSNFRSANTRLGTAGAYGGIVPADAATPIILDGSDLDIYLFQYDGITLNTGGDATTDYVAKLRITSDGDVVLNPEDTPVPVPAAVCLLGSGLLGLVGIRRKNN